jgi:hypothetical protein
MFGSFVENMEKKTLVCEAVHHDFVRKLCCGKQPGKCSICSAKKYNSLESEKNKSLKKNSTESFLVQKFEFFFRLPNSSTFFDLIYAKKI